MKTSRGVVSGSVVSGSVVSERLGSGVAELNYTAA